MSDIDQLLAQLLAGQTKQAKARSAVNGRFTTLLDSQINIGPGVRSRASRSQTSLRDLLRGENGRDSGFPRILQSEDSDFLGGSFDRHVKVWPLDDIDVLFPIDGSGLYYSENGLRSRFHVRTDDRNINGDMAPKEHQRGHGTKANKNKVVPCPRDTSVAPSNSSHGCTRIRKTNN